MPVQTNDKYCPICGKPVADLTYNRFGEFCCSDAHAEEYVKEVRTRKVAAVQDRVGAPAGARRGGCC